MKRVRLHRTWQRDRLMTFTEYLEKNIVVFDGAMGTQLAKLNPPENAWAGHTGCNEALVLGAPELVAEVHRLYFEAGAAVTETNTFGAAAHTLAQFDLSNRCEEINEKAARTAKAVAHASSTHSHPRFVAGSMGPGSKLPSLGQIDFDELTESFRPQCRGLITGGADVLIIETCQDPLQVKAALTAASDAMDDTGIRLPVMVSVTIEEQGSMLAGTQPEALAAIVAPFEPLSIGLNCATGPSRMLPHLKAIRTVWNGRISAIPNAGLPRIEEGRTSYELDPESFTEEMISLQSGAGLSIVGGCCGTTPAHIKKLSAAFREKTPPEQSERPESGCLASLYVHVPFVQSPPPAIIGEKLNANGSKKFRRILEAGDIDEIVEFSKKQQHRGAHLLDLCVAVPGRNEKKDMIELVRRMALDVQSPLVIDSTDPGVIETALKNHGGRLLVNSANLEKGEEHFEKMCALVRRYSAALIVLTIDEEGMAKTADEKVRIAHRIIDLAAGFGLKKHDLVFDPLTFTVGSGDESLRNAASETLSALERIKKEIPGSHTILGVSNVSYGLPKKAREVLNAVFFHRAVEKGMDLAIVDAGRMQPLVKIPDMERELADALIMDDRENGDPLTAFIEHFSEKTESRHSMNTKITLSPPERLESRIIEGSKKDIESIIDELLWHMKPKEILDGILMPSMRKVGELFDRGELPLPFVLKSAEIMRTASNYVGKKMDESDAFHRGSVLVLATVKGDVHDVGKDLVDLLLTNHGHRIVNLGTRVPLSKMVQAAHEHNANAIGMSGLLTSSALEMQENLRQMHAMGLKLPVLLGGAALNRGFVENECAPEYPDSIVTYCPDPFRGLEVLDALARSDSARAVDEAFFVSTPDEQVPVPEYESAVDVEGADEITSELAQIIDVDPQIVFKHLDDLELYSKRWGFVQHSMPDDVYREFLSSRAAGLLVELKEQVLDESLLTPRLAFARFPCRGGSEVLEVLSGSGRSLASFRLPQTKSLGGKSAADFFADDGTSTLMLQLVTIGPLVAEKGRLLFESGRYRNRFLLHGLCAELTEALADVAGEMIRGVLELPESAGARISPGYPAWPDLKDNAVIADLLDSRRMGVSVEPGGMLVPEYSTAGMFYY